MRISLNAGRLLSFERRLTTEEQKDYKQNAITPALEYLGTEEVSMIVHGTCFPEGSRDLGAGSPYGKVAAQFIPFEILHGFNSNQLGPVGTIRNPRQISPYKSSINSKSFLFIDFNELTQKKYANILTEQDLNSVMLKPQKSLENYSYSNFPEAFANYDYLIQKAHTNLNKKVYAKDPDAIKLRDEYTEFKKVKGPVLYKEALFKVLEDTYRTDDFDTWSDVDKNLIERLNQKDPDAIARYKVILTRSKNALQNFMFGQFLVNKQIKENAEFRKKLNFKYNNDVQGGFSKSEEWANQDIFLSDYRLGCPYGGENGPQHWNLPVLNPQKLFNEDGSLGKAGIYLKNKFETALENFDNTRIDHVMGLVDPYIYNKYTKIGTNVSHMPEIDPNGNYKQVLNKIILPVLEERGIDKNAPIWENLGSTTPVFDEIYYRQNNLPGISQLEWMRGEKCMGSENWGLIGSHDSDPAAVMVKKDWIKNNEAWNPLYLAGLLNSNPERTTLRDAFCKKIADNDAERIKAKFAELFFTHKRIQISFADFLGINKTYNMAGHENDMNWKLRINKDYEQDYYDNLSSQNPTAINMPEILKMAVQAKMDKDIVQKQPVDKEKVGQILEKLDKYETILKTPENAADKV